MPTSSEKRAGRWREAGDWPFWGMTGLAAFEVREDAFLLP
jgi:hypothetical protein